MPPVPDPAECHDPSLTRRGIVRAALGGLTLGIGAGGCGRTEGLAGVPSARLEATWGGHGLLEKTFVKPRAIAIDRTDRLFIVDFRAVIRVFTTLGEPLGMWQTPTHEKGRPSGLAMTPEGNLAVADSHYHQVLFYSPEGTLLGRVGGEPARPGEPAVPSPGIFDYLGDIAFDSKGNLYVAEGQRHERIWKFGPGPEFKALGHWGDRGTGPREFQRIRSMEFDADDQLWIADACNHRIQILDAEGNFLRAIGAPGSGPGELDYPYDLALARDGSVLVCEYGNHRVQRLDRDGRCLGLWGKAGRGAGMLWNPWSLGVDSKNRVHVLDSNNHRVHRIRF